MDIVVKKTVITPNNYEIKTMKSLFTLLFTLVCCVASAQRIGCVQSEPHRDAVPGRALNQASDLQLLPDPLDFDPQKTYRQPVVLISFSDMEFSMSDPAAYYDRLFNESGFNEGMGKGCVADYFREQSGGRLNLQFDIYGPVKVDGNAGGHRGIYLGTPDVSEAIHKLCETETTDFAIYDWDGDSLVNQVIFIAAGFTGNKVSGYIYPNTGFIFSSLPGGISPYFGSISCELWADSTVCGMGTIIHEFCHCLGLPDIYPLAPASYFSTVDEWDIMDGGNFTNKGWCPPNLSAMEKMYLGWDMPVELTEPVHIEGMKPLSDGGDTYIIRSSSNSDEFYLLENRRQEGWDYGCPGNGLLIFHVDYSKDSWCNANVNISDSHYRYDLFHADGKDYLAWNPNNNGGGLDKWTMENWLRSSYFSTSPYPFIDPATSVVNACLTDDSDPAATLFTANAEGLLLMGKPITNIQLADDGTISFDFMKTAEVGIVEPRFDTSANFGWYSSDGRCLGAKPTSKGLYIHNGQKVIIP